VAVIRPSGEINCMLRACVKADIIVPVMSPALEDDDTAMRVLTWCEKSKKQIVPAKINTDNYQQKGWLGALTAGALWFDVYVSPDKLQDWDTAVTEMNPKALQLLEEAKNHTNKETIAPDDLIDDGCHTKGWYYDPVHSSRADMEFDFFALMSGVVTGQGKDMVERFLISGHYDNDGHIEFIKSYIGTHSHEVVYTGDIKGDPKTGLVISGRHNYGGDFELRISNSNKENHVMLSYQWNSQPTVKKIAERLKRNGVKIWFDIDGSMQGNVNVAMADGVERAKCLVSFHTEHYAKSVNCKKELAYAAALSKPVIPVNLQPDIFDYNVPESAEHYWISKIVADCATVDPLCLSPETKGDESLKLADILCEVIDNTQCEPEPPMSSGIDGQGGTATTTVQDKIASFSGGSVSGWYVEPSDGSTQEMSFEYFALALSGTVRGQGEDRVGPFIIMGNFKVPDDEVINVHFSKQYVGRYTHVVKYDGVLCDNCIKGRHNYGGDFSIQSDA